MTTAIEGNPATTENDIVLPGKLKTDDILEILYRMMLIRRFEQRTMQNYMAQKIGGFCHIYTGQEAVAVGSLFAVNDDDPVITAYRDHGYVLARGGDPRPAMAELFGKATGLVKGRGGSMHFFDKEKHIYGGHAIVAGQLPLAAGLGFGIQYKGEDKVCICYLGDGSLNQGAFHEAMNLAAIWRLPVLFVIENNFYSMGTEISRGTSEAYDLKRKADAYGMRYVECDGKDVLEMYSTICDEAEKTRGSTSKLTGSKHEAGGGPILVNAKTYRYEGHSMSDPQKYRSKEEVVEEEEKDCINTLVSHLIESGLSTQEHIDSLDEKAKQEAKDAVKFAEQSPEPSFDEMYEHVYVNPFPPFV